MYNVPGDKDLTKNVSRRPNTVDGNNWSASAYSGGQNNNNSSSVKVKDSVFPGKEQTIVMPRNPGGADDGEMMKGGASPSARWATNPSYAFGKAERNADSIHRDHWKRTTPGPGAYNTTSSSIGGIGSVGGTSKKTAAPSYTMSGYIVGKKPGTMGRIQELKKNDATPGPGSYGGDYSSFG